MSISKRPHVTVAINVSAASVRTETAVTLNQLRIIDWRTGWLNDDMWRCPVSRESQKTISASHSYALTKKHAQSKERAIRWAWRTSSANGMFVVVHGGPTITWYFDRNTKPEQIQARKYIESCQLVPKLMTSFDTSGWRYFFIRSWRHHRKCSRNCAQACLMK